MLTEKMAGEIVRQTMIRLKRNINIMDHSGTIIASGDPERVNRIHEGALEVLSTGKPVVIYENSQKYWQGAQPGINLPITFQNRIIGVIGITGKPEEIAEFGELVKMSTEMMITQSFLTSQLEWKQRLKERIFEELTSANPRQEFIEQRLNLLNIRLEPPFQVALVEIEENPFTNQELIQRMEETLGGTQVLPGFVSANRLFILTSHMTEKEVRKKLQSMQSVLRYLHLPFRIGLGTSVSQQEDIRLSLEEAKWALLLGQKEQSFISYPEIETKAFLDRLDEQVKQKYISRVLAHLSERMLNTLEVFFDCNLNIGEAAKKLYIHRNTLVYRLKKINQETGYNPQVFQDAVSLQLAVWMYRLKKKSE
ncbi:CdaR family transcriptional regulator [Aneurinibacillus sp. UBA3580]|jgi:carbohydrate diacid regulator|uniref:CdaR family transcriptional regulator n=1 Tax=Aneurinibacillus sp. UBA3580 TaxID=1946041 RepID=UPI00257E1A8E|nr:sugar diacid recognition domain-containing protein [Aneurinibacillus sp. UBA3580]